MENEIKKKELNSLLIGFLILSSICSIVHSITTGVSNLMWFDKGSEYLAFIPTFFTIINAFIIIYFIVLKRNIAGVWIFFGMLFLQFLSFIYMDGKSLDYAFLFVITRVVMLSLVLLLREDGESAWKTLLRKENQKTDLKNESIVEINNEETNPIVKYLTYALTGVVFIVMIIVIWGLLSNGDKTAQVNVGAQLSNTENALNTSDNIPFTYQGVSFDYSNKWEIEKKVIQEDYGYQVFCDGVDGDVSIVITWFNTELDPREWINSTLTSDNSSFIISNVVPISKTDFKGFDAFMTDYDVEVLGEKMYGQTTAFNTKDKSFTITKLADSIIKLYTELKVIENSLMIE